MTEHDIIDNIDELVREERELRSRAEGQGLSEDDGALLTFLDNGSTSAGTCCGSVVRVPNSVRTWSRPLRVPWTRWSPTPVVGEAAAHQEIRCAVAVCDRCGGCLPRQSGELNRLVVIAI